MEASSVQTKNLSLSFLLLFYSIFLSSWLSNNLSLMAHIMQHSHRTRAIVIKLESNEQAESRKRNLVEPLG